MAHNITKGDLADLPPELIKELSAEAQGLVKQASRVKDCPFCHRHNWSVMIDKPIEAVFIKCNSCHACGPRVPGSRLQAILAWNDRMDDA